MSRISTSAIASCLLTAYLFTANPALSEPEVTPSVAKPRAEEFANDVAFRKYLEAKIPKVQWINEIMRIGEPRIFPVHALAEIWRNGTLLPLPINTAVTLKTIDSAMPTSLVFRYSLAVTAKEAEKLEWKAIDKSICERFCNGLIHWLKSGYQTLHIFSVSEKDDFRRTTIGMKDCQVYDRDWVIQAMLDLNPEYLEHIFESMTKSPLYSAEQNAKLKISLDRFLDAAKEKSFKDKDWAFALLQDIVGGKIAHYIIARGMVERISNSAIPEAEHGALIQSMQRFAEGLRRNTISVNEARKVFGAKGMLDDDVLRRVSAEVASLADTAKIEKKSFSVDLADELSEAVDACFEAKDESKRPEIFF